MHSGLGGNVRRSQMLRKGVWDQRNQPMLGCGVNKRHIKNPKGPDPQNQSFFMGLHFTMGVEERL